MLILVLLSLVIFVFSVSEVYADTFQGSENDNYLFLNISDDYAFALLRIDGKIISIQEEVKYYKNETFRINFENKIILIGVPNNNEIKIKIHDFEKKQKITLVLQKIDTKTKYEKPIKEKLTIQEKFELSEKTTGMELVVPLDKSDFKKAPNIEKIPRSQYIESTDKEIKILSVITKRIVYYEEFFFNIRTVDSSINKIGNDFWNDIGFLNDVEINSIIKDPNGIILNEFAGNTTGKGYYTSPRILFPYNTILPNAYTMELNATKYFDESATFTTNSITDEFFVFVPTNNKLNVECNFIYQGSCVEFCTSWLLNQPPFENDPPTCLIL